MMKSHTPQFESRLRHRVQFCLTSFLLGLAALPLPGAEPDIRRDATVIAVERIMPSVVNIATRTRVERRGYVTDWFQQFRIPFRQEMPSQYSAGSGVIIDEEGIVMTNVHVVEDADEVWVKLADNSPPIRAERVVGYLKSDIALLRIIGKPGQKFKAARFAADDDLLLGETVLAIGNPFGLGGSVSRGILSSKTRRPAGANEEQLEIADWLQTDAAINPGNSGGPLVNLRGEVIGINVAMYKEGRGIGFAIPVNQVNEALAEVFNPEVLESLWFGARVKAGRLPLRVMSVQASSPAQKAGLQAGDLIVSINDKAPSGYIDFNRELLSVGDQKPASLTIQRAGERKNLTLRLVPERTFFNAELIRQKIGASLQQLTPELAETLQLNTTEGLVIASVDKNAPAEEAQLQRRYIIQAIDGQTTRDLTTAAKILYAKKKGERTLLNVVVERNIGNFRQQRTGTVELKVR